MRTWDFGFQATGFKFSNLKAETWKPGIVIALSLVALLLTGLSGPAFAAPVAKPTAPPTPTSPPPPTQPPSTSPPPTTVLPTPTTKPPALPTPTSPPPAALPPTQAPPSVAPTAVPTPVPATASAEPTATATPTPAATVSREMPSPTPTLELAWSNPPAQSDAGSSRDSGSDPGSLLAWFRSLPSWVLPTGIAGLAFCLLFGVWLVTRFIHYTGRDLQVKKKMIAESEAARLEERRREVEAVLVGQKDWQRIASQVIADTLGRAVQLNPEVPPRVGGKPAPYFTIAGSDETRYTFTTDVRAMQAVGLLKKHIRSRRIASPVEPGLVWRHLAETWLREAGEVVPAVPRDAGWVLVVVG